MLTKILLFYCIKLWLGHIQSMQILCGALTKRGYWKHRKNTKRATKLVMCLKQLPYIERLKQLKMPTLKYRRLRGDMIELFKIIHHYYDPGA